MTDTGATESAAPTPAVAALRAGWADAARPARFVSLGAALLAGVLAAADLATYRNGEMNAHRLFPGSTRATFDAALALAFLAVAWAVPRAGRVLLAVIAGAIGVLEIVEEALGTHAGVDETILASGAGPGRMSLLVALLVTALALSHILAASAAARARRLAGGLALAVTALSATWVIVYAFGSRAWRSDIAGRSAATTMVGLLLLGVAAVTAVPGGAAEWLFLGRDAGARVARRLVPAALALPVIGAVLVRGHDAGWYPATTVLAGLAVALTLVTAVGSWVLARRIRRIDLARARTAAELTELRVTYARLLREHAQKPMGVEDRAAVLEDRQRIAADLHDIVIQRLFAAGMTLQIEPVADRGLRRRLDEVALSMDRAIRDLRASIFELRRADGNVGLSQAVRSVAGESARMLGFTPLVQVRDPDGAAEPFADDILAVLREALANVARHAAATSVQVELRASDDEVILSVTDDGSGLIEAPHRSGTHNLERRARSHAGDCSWTSVRPHGTRMVWHVPRPPGRDASLSVAG